MTWAGATWLAFRGGRSDRLRIVLTVASTAVAAVFVLLAGAVVTEPDPMSGTVYANFQLWTEDGLRGGTVFALALLCLPFLAFAAQCSRIGAPARERRFEDLARLGATRRELRRVTAIESGLASPGRRPRAAALRPARPRRRDGGWPRLRLPRRQRHPRRHGVDGRRPPPADRPGADLVGRRPRPRPPAPPRDPVLLRRRGPPGATWRQRPPPRRTAGTVRSPPRAAPRHPPRSSRRHGAGRRSSHRGGPPRGAGLRLGAPRSPASSPWRRGRLAVGPGARPAARRPADVPARERRGASRSRCSSAASSGGRARAAVRRPGDERAAGGRRRLLRADLRPRARRPRAGDGGQRARAARRRGRGGRRAAPQPRHRRRRRGAARGHRPVRGPRGRRAGRARGGRDDVGRRAPRVVLRPRASRSSAASGSETWWRSRRRLALAALVAALATLALPASTDVSEARVPA